MVVVTSSMPAAGAVVPLVLRSGGPEDTGALAGALAALCVPGDVLLLAGDLGAGKTTFAQGFGRALGVVEPITSPTFTLMRQHPVSGASSVAGADPIRTLLHADVYRLDRLQEIVDLGLGELVEDGGVALVEWGDVAAPVLGPGSLAVRLEADGIGGGDGAAVSGPGTADPDDCRTITLTSLGPRWDGRWSSLTAAVRPWSATA